MDCRTFKESHVAFVDDTLPGIQQQAMREHLLVCRACAAHDTRVRRSLMAARSLEPIVPSRDFASRLRSRLEAERIRVRIPVPITHGPSFTAFLSAAVTVIGVGVLAVELQLRQAPPAALPELPGVVASLPAVSDTFFASSSAFAAALSTSAPVWSLAYVADQMPMRYATAQLSEDLREH